MRINNNLMAMNTHRQLGTANTDSAKSIEKLSSGYRINRAGDDAAGLAISEKMRGQIRGLNQASSNAQDGISLIQTAEGALNETHAILQRMRELSVQAASDTNVEADRGEIQKELTQLTEEIDRIATTTEFNTMKLVNGDRATTHEPKDVAIDKTYGVTAALGISGTLKGVGDITLKDTADFKWSDVDSTATKNTITINKGADGLSVSIKGLEKGVANALEVTDVFLTANKDGSHSYDSHGVSFTVSKKDFEAMVDGTSLVVDVGTNVTGDATSTATADATTAAIKTKNNWETHDGTATIDAGVVVDGSKMIDGAASVKIEGDATGENFTVTIFGADGTTKLSEDKITKATSATTFEYNNHGVSFKMENILTTAGSVEMTIDLETKKGEGAVIEDKSLKFQVGANEDQSIGLSIGDMGAKALAIDTIKVDSHDSAKAAVTTVNEAIERVSAERSKLGAVQNRLEHTIKNLDTSSENLQAAEARIRDVDMAKEMMEQTKQNILAQASTAMLAQANQAPQAVLQLLR